MIGFQLQKITKIGLSKKMIRYLTILVLNFFDFIHKRKIINFFNKKKIKLEYIIDVGAHHGETIDLFLKNFEPKKIYSFEASPDNFNILEKKIKKYEIKIRKSIQIENLALGKNNRIDKFNQTLESSSSTFNQLNIESSYFSKKKLFLGLKKNDKFFKEIDLKIVTLDSYFSREKLEKADLLKIDTEGFEFEILQGFKQNINKIEYILFEHHYDDMIKKNYKFSDINQFLKQNNFKLIFKVKMPFRKSFEYIYKKDFL